MNDDSIDTREVVRPPVNIPHRPVNYTPAQGNGTGNGGSSQDIKKHRRLLIFVGDMIQVTDPKSHLQGKYGLVEEIHPRNPQYNIIMKIGAIRNPLKFSQVRFCTRISPTINNGLKNNDPKNNSTKEEEIETSKVGDYIDELDDESIGNREGENLKHSVKL
jgi:hypothetical protein